MGEKVVLSRGTWGRSEMPTMESLSSSVQPEELFPSEDLERRIQRVKQCHCCGALGILIPVLRCTECGAAMDIKCHVYKQGGRFYAECLTLDLLSQGATEEDAIRRLQVAMFSYVGTAVRGGSSEGLIPRPAPLSSWVRYYISGGLGRIAGLFGRRRPVMVRTIPTGDPLTLMHCS